MKRIKSVSLLALLTINGSALANLQEPNLPDLCSEIEQSGPNNRIEEYSKEELIQLLEKENPSTEETKLICSYLKLIENKIDDEDLTLKSNDGWTR